MHRLLTQDAKIIIPKFKGTASEMILNTNNREKMGIFSIITGIAGLAYKGVSVYLKWKKTMQKKKDIKPCYPVKNVLKTDYIS